MSKRHIIILLIATLSLFPIGCQDYFDYTPYAIESEQHRLTANNLARIEASSRHHFEPFKFAVIADTHAYYDELKAVIPLLNQRNDLAFLLIAGDLTDFGLQQEYQWMVDLLAKLRIPYLTVIGNHDALNNGKDNYRAFFGDFDYSFTYNRVKFVALNSNSWEFDNTAPRLDWLRSELSRYHLYHHQIVLTHIRPYDSRFALDFSQAYAAAMEENFVSLVVAGHDHTHDYREVILSHGQTIGYMAAGTLKYRGYVIVTVEANRVTIVPEVF